MVDSSFYGDTPNYATDFPTQNDSNTNPVAGNTAAPSSFYPNGGIYEELANSDDVLAAAANSAASAAASATGAASSATASAASAAAAAASASTASTTFLQKTNNLSDLTSVATAKANLSLVKGDVGLGNVDNTSDVNKPVSTAQATADALVASNAAAATALKANIASPALTGTPSAPTAAALNNSTQIATTAYADAAVNVEKTRALAAEALKAPLASPALTGVPTAPTAAVGTNTTQLATTAFVLASSSSVSIQDTAPSSPQPGALWWNSATGLLYVYYNDGNSSQWVFAASGAVQNGVLFDGPQTLNSTQQDQAQKNLGMPGILRGYLQGLTLSTAGSSPIFGIAAGVANDSTFTDFMSLPSAYTKTTSAWAVGTGNGALDTGSLSANAWYHAYLIKRPDTGVVDVLFSASATAPTLPTNYTLFRRIGSMRTNISAQWTRFIQDGNTFMWATPSPDVAATNPGTAAVTRTLMAPTGIRVGALISAGVVTTSAGEGVSGYVSDLSLDDVTPNIANAITFEAYIPSTATAGYALAGSGTVMTNTSAQVRTRMQASSAAVILYINTYGWIDTRGIL